MTLLYKHLKSTLVFFTLFISFYASAQSYTAVEPRKSKYPSVKFGYLDATTMTIDQILGNPTLSCKESGCEVLGYELWIARRGKDYYGPYDVKGATLNKNLQNLIKNIDVMTGTMYFVNIRVRQDGKEIILPEEYILIYRH